MNVFTDDAVCALQIKNGLQAPWEQLLDNVTDTILWVALAWCAPACARGTCSLLRRQGAMRDRLAEDDCDCVIACYVHIAKKHLPAIVARYAGEDTLTVWCIRSLRSLANDKFRRIDFARTGHTCARETHLSLHVPRLRTPECLRQAPEAERELHRLICHGKSREEVALTLKISTEAAQERIEALQAQLAEADWEAYVEMTQRQNYKLGARIGALADEGIEEGSEFEPVAGGPSVEQRWQLRQVTGAIAAWVRSQSATDRELVRLFVHQGLSAAEVARQLGGFPGGPGSPRQVYSRVETLLNRMHCAVQHLLAPIDTVQPEKKIFVENLPCLLALIGDTQLSRNATAGDDELIRSIGPYRSSRALSD